MNYKEIISDFSAAVLAQGVYALVSALLTLVLPKVLGVEGFGYWQLFIFYAGYIGFFHLGLNDGLYLLKGGETRSRIDKKDVNSQFAYGMLVQFLVSIAVMLFAFFAPLGDERTFVVFMTGALITINNAGAFFGFLYQAMGETKLFSTSVVVESLFVFVGLLVLMAMGVTSYAPYVVMYFFAKVARLIYCFFHGMDFLRAGLYSSRYVIKACCSSISVGIKLMLANTAGALIIGFARFLIDVNWGVEVFSQVSLSLSLTTFFMTFISQASMVLFPALRQTGHNDIALFYARACDALNSLLPITYLLYAPIVFVLGLWLPDYQESFVFFAYVFPMCVFEGKMDILGTTYLKVLRKERYLLVINLITLGASALLTLVGTYLVHSVDFVLISIIFMLGLRELIVESSLSRLLALRFSSASVAAVFLSAAFVGAYIVFGAFIGTMIYTVLLVGYFVAYRSMLARVLGLFRR